MNDQQSQPEDILDLPIFFQPTSAPDEIPALPPSPSTQHLVSRTGAAAPTVGAQQPEWRPRREQRHQPPPYLQQATVPPQTSFPQEDSPVQQDDRELDWDVVARLRGEVSDLLAKSLESSPGMSENDRRANAQAHISDVVAQEVDRQATIGGDRAVWSEHTRNRMARAVFDAIFKLGRLQPLVDMANVENIDIYGHDNVWVEFADGTKKKFPPVAQNDQELISEIAFLAQRGGEDGRSFTPANPDLDMDLPGGARLAAVHPPISPRVKVVIRLHRLIDVSLDQLAQERGSLSMVAADFLRAAVLAGVSIIVAGLPKAGKTTFVRALANEIPPLEPIVTIEKERELYLDRMGDAHQIVTALQYRPGQGEVGADGTRAGEVTLVQLLEKSLRLNTERIIVGEVRGGEVDAMFQAMQAGAGSISTIHAQSPTETIERLAGLALRDLGTGDGYAYRQIEQHIGLVVQLSRVYDPKTGTYQRMVTHIAQVQPGESGPDGTARPIAVDLFKRAHGGRFVPAIRPTEALLNLVEIQGFDPSRLSGEVA